MNELARRCDVEGQQRLALIIAEGGLKIFNLKVVVQLLMSLTKFIITPTITKKASPRFQE